MSFKFPTPTISLVKKLLTRLTTNTGTYPQKSLPTKLNPKPTTESHSRMMIPLSTNKDDMVGYIDAQNNVRIGRLLEDLDMVAVIVLQKSSKILKKS